MEKLFWRNESRTLIHEGFMKKSPPEKKIYSKWHRRYFKLWSDKTLEYYKRKGDMRPLKDAIDLEKCISVIDSPNHEHVRKKNYHHVLCINTLARNYYLVCDSEDEKNEWRRKICEVREFSGTMTTEDLLELVQKTPEANQRSRAHSENRSNLLGSRTATMLSTSLPSITAHAIRCNTNVTRKSDNVLNDPADDSSESSSTIDESLNSTLDNSLLEPESVSDLERSTSSASRSSNRSRHQVYQLSHTDYSSKSLEGIDSEPIYNMAPSNPRPMRPPNKPPSPNLNPTLNKQAEASPIPKPSFSPLLNRAATESQSRPISPFRSPKRQAKTVRKKSLDMVIDDDVYVPMGSNDPVVFNASKLGQTQSLPPAAVAMVGNKVTVQFNKPVSTSSDASSADEQDNYEVMHASGTFSNFTDSHTRSNSVYNHHRVFSPMKGQDIEEECYVEPSNVTTIPEGYDVPPPSRKISSEYDYPPSKRNDYPSPSGNRDDYPPLTSGNRKISYDNNHPGSQIHKALNKGVFYDGGGRRGAGPPPPLPPPLPYVSDEGSGGSSGRRSPRLMQIPILPPKPESQGDMPPIPCRSLKPNPQVNRNLKPATLTKKLTIDDTDRSRQSNPNESRQSNPSVFDKYDEPVSTPFEGYGDLVHEYTSPHRPHRSVPGYDEPLASLEEPRPSFIDNTPETYDGHIRILRRRGSDNPSVNDIEEPHAPFRPPKPSSSNSPSYQVPKLATAYNSSLVSGTTSIGVGAQRDKYSNHNVALALQKYQMFDDGYPELRQDYNHPKLHQKQSLRSQSSQDEHYEEHVLMGNRTPSTDLLTPEHLLTSDSRNSSVSSRSSVSTEGSHDGHRDSLSYSNVMSTRRSMVTLDDPENLEYVECNLSPPSDRDVWPARRGTNAQGYITVDIEKTLAATELRQDEAI